LPEEPDAHLHKGPLRFEIALALLSLAYLLFFAGLPFVFNIVMSFQMSP
jgi:ABC-type sugar transport system permease subunit